MPSVIVTPPSTIKVQVGNQFTGTVQSIAYGTRTLKSATDLTIAGANTGDAIIYNSTTKNFEVLPVTSTPTLVDGGLFW